MASIFNYGFDIAEENFKKENVNLISLCDYSTIIDTALSMDLIKNSDIELLKEWRLNPDKFKL